MSSWTRRQGLAALGAVALGGSVGLHAQSAWPTRPITFVVGYPPGGGSDTMARMVAQRMSLLLGQPIVVENRPGGAGQVAAAAVARSTPDGHTLLIDASSFVINPSLGLKLAYTTRSFVPVGLLALFPLVVVTHPTFAARTMGDVISLARAKPGAVFFASAGSGSVQQIIGAMMMQSAGIELTHVPYKGASAAMNDVMAGQVALFFANAVVALPQVQSGKLRALAVTGPKRLAELPDVPTLAETPIGDVNVREWNGLFAPTGTSPDIVDRLAVALRGSLNDPDIRKRIAALSGEPFTGTQAEAAQFVEAEAATMARVIRERGIKAE